MNFVGLVIIVVGIILAIIALRGTQHQVFPFFFGQSSTTSSGSSNSSGQQCSCPVGWVPVLGRCYSLTQVGISLPCNVS